ncbi:MarR family winged helix-turn-helix transcriptional regulator [Phytoactinopolyspora endophytica]|uniref:MarR family winged helix-turn-helix transcriptional regulator n=1 Tax=Phytoactinopolyspora endophytica TaxID=1642495 RepID=UPI00101CEA5E|nr:MarR family winged helix-turn-helix transcriptional regulator [Phytoactinopolyspora endophytica]
MDDPVEKKASSDAALDRVLWALRRAEMAMQALKEQRLRPLGLAPAHYSLMLSVRVDPGLTGAELARRLGVTPQAVASLVGKLEKRGHLRRRAHPRHRHIQELYLTESGVEELAAADAEIASLEHQVVQTLGATDARQLKKLLHHVADAMQATSAAAESGGTTRQPASHGDCTQS